MAVGFLLGPVLHLVDPGEIAPVAPILTSLALLMIVFDGALSLNLYKVLGESGKALVLAVLGVAASMGVTVGVAHFGFGWSYMEALLLGALVGGTSSSVIIAIISQMRAPDRIVTLLTLESTFTDAIVIVMSIALVQVMSAQGDASPLATAGRDIASAFSVGAVAGGVVGLVWVRMLARIKAERYNDILTLSVALLFYALVEQLGGNGAVFALTFGLVLANGTELGRILRMKESVEATDVMRSFMSQLTFFVRTFFFVYLGFIVVMNGYQSWVFGLLLSLALVLGRLVVVWVTGFGDALLRAHTPLITAMLARGLVAAVVAQFVAASSLARAREFPDVVTAVIISTVLFTSVLSSVLKGRLARAAEPQPAPSSTSA
ncbi:MAG: cation:proton antiporter [Chloroflexota bacterium]|nr:cation:proton antiporter [Chloroflexota bacterium]